jgi:hypothetical protein
MCCSLRPANFTGPGTTVIFSLAWHPNQEQLVHVLVYENTPHNHSEGPNAMLLHFPALPMGPDNVVDTSNASNIARDAVRAVEPPARMFGRHQRDDLIGSRVPEAHVFDSGIYTVVLAQDPRAIPDALNRVPPNKRPEPNPEIFEWYAQWRPNWPVALCCFDSKEAVRANPMMWWYVPRHVDTAFLPALDAHDGHPPRLDHFVDVNHWAIFGINLRQPHRLPKGMDDVSLGLRPVYYRDVLTPVQAELLPTHVLGRSYQGKMRNRDFLLPINDLVEDRSDRITRGLLEA